MRDIAFDDFIRNRNILKDTYPASKIKRDIIKKVSYEDYDHVQQSSDGRYLHHWMIGEYLSYEELSLPARRVLAEYFIKKNRVAFIKYYLMSAGSSDFSVVLEVQQKNDPDIYLLDLTYGYSVKKNIYILKDYEIKIS